MNVATAKRKWRAYERDPRTRYGLEHNRSLPPSHVKKWMDKRRDDSPAITLGGIIELCEQGAAVHVYEDKIVIAQGAFAGVSKLWPETEHLIIDALLPWINCT